MDCDRNPIVEVSGDDNNQSGNMSSSDLLESAADYGPESATGDCLMCSDTKEVAINSTHKKFQKKVWTSCSITKGYLWSKAQLKQIGDSGQAVWESDYEVIKTEWELTLKEDCHSFEVNKMMDRTEQLFHFKEAAHLKIRPHESEAGSKGGRRPLCNN